MDFLKKVEGVKAEDKDVLGGSFVWNTSVYDVVIKNAYLDSSDSGAYNVNFLFETPEGKKLNQTIYVTNKAGSNTYVDKNGNKQYLPGFLQVDTIALLSTGSNIGDLDTEEKLVEVYDKEAGKRLPKPRKVFIDMLNKKLKLGVIKIVEPKYNNPDETREVNEINKVFNEDGFTKTELEADSKEPVFINEWSNKFTSEFIKDKTKGKFNKPTENKPKKSLF
jgi:hypothetical protein